jgi:serine protease inhibitor
MTNSLILTSLLCKDTYPNNHGGDFYNVLNQELNFADGWKMALNEIIYEPNAWDDVREDHSDIKISMVFKPSITVNVEIHVLSSVYFRGRFHVKRYENGVVRWYGAVSYDAKRRVAHFDHIP